MIFAPLVAALALVSAASAQVSRSSSIDPLNGTPFATPVVPIESTYTLVSTYETAGTRVATAISGSVGPTAAPEAYTFSYGVPVSTLTGTDLSNVQKSLTANGSPTGPGPLAPNPTGLDIVADGAAALPATGLTALLAVAGAAIAGAALL